MENRMMCIAVAFAAFFLIGVVTAQDCTTAATQLTSCLSYITGPEFSPPSACCQAVMTVNMKNPTCVCTVFAQLDQSNPSVNVTKAYALPKNCNLMVNTASCKSTMGAPPLPGFAVPPGIALPSSPLTVPPGLSPIILPPTSFAEPPLMPPMSASPPEFSVSPASTPTEMSPAEEPVADSPVSYAPAAGPVSADGPAIAEGPGADDGTVPVAESSDASVVSVSMILCATMAGVLALLL